MIEYADRIVQKVVESVNEAVDAVVHIIKMIEAFIEDVIRFLRMMFDWGAILDAQNILKQIANQQMRAVRQITDRGQEDFMKMLTAAFTERFECDRRCYETSSCGPECQQLPCKRSASGGACSGQQRSWKIRQRQS